MSQKLPAYGIFEGGGAKGIAHIGGLKAAEVNDFEFIGVAGTSAGAVIAALVAVGYSADSLFDPNNNANILSVNNIKPLDLLGVDKWSQVKNFEARLRRFVNWTWALGVLGGISRSPGVGSVVRDVWRTKGVFSTEKIRKIVNKLIHQKIEWLRATNGTTEPPLPDRVRFCDIDSKIVPECCPLKIIATDIHSQEMVIFGPETPDVEIALAVAASVAIPLVFQPVEITWRHNGSAKTALFADGGLVSNLPVWAFEEEKQEFERITPLAPRVPVLAFSLVDSPVKQVAKPDAGGVAAADGAVPLKDGLELPQYVGMVARAAVYGSQSRIQRYMEDLYVIVLESSLSVLKFDLGINDARAAYQDGYRSGAERLRRTMRIQPGKVRAELVRFHDGVLDALNLHRSTRTLPPITRLRVAMIQRFGDRSMRVTHSINMDQDSEDRLKLDLRGVGAPEAYRTREPAFLLLPKSRAAGALPFFTKYELALVPSHVVSLIAIPVFEDYGAWSIAAPALRPQPLGVLCIDSEEDLVLAFADGHFLQALATASAACAPLFGKS